MRNWLHSMEFNLWSDFFSSPRVQMALKEMPCILWSQMQHQPRIVHCGSPGYWSFPLCTAPPNLPTWTYPFNQGKLSSLLKYIRWHAEGWVRLTDSEIPLPNKCPFVASDPFFPLPVSILDFLMWVVGEIRWGAFYILRSCTFSAIVYCLKPFHRGGADKNSFSIFFLLLSSHCPEKYKSYILSK